MRADEDGEAPERAPDDHAMQYTTRAEPHYLRAAAEVGLILGAGSIQYAAEQGNSTDWDYEYDWPSLQKKLTGEGVSLDTNRFDTNMLTHPASGLFYYWVARTNRLDVHEAALYAFAASTLWEYVGELREKASVNDMIVTPVAGIAIGEPLVQLGAFFDRGRESTLTDGLGWLFGGPKRLHDAIDGDVPARSWDTDGLGFSRDAGHAFVIGAGGGGTAQDTRTYGDARVYLSTHLVNIPEYNRGVAKSRFFHDGNVSSLVADASFGGTGLTDLWLASEVAPLGWYEQALAGDGDALVGYRWSVGLTVGFDYAMHEYDRARATSIDQISSVYAGGARIDHETAFDSGLHVEETLDVHPSFAAVRSLAVDDYLASGKDRARIPTVLSEESYYYAVGATLAGSLEARYLGARFGAAGRLDGYFGIGGLDRYPDRVHDVRAARDRRSLVRAWVGYEVHSPFELSVEAVRRFRDGSIEDVVARRDEASVSCLGSVRF